MASLKQKLYLLIVYLVIFGTLMAGCSQGSEPTDPMIHNVNTKMHCTILSTDGQIIDTYKAQLVLSITDYATAEDYIKITLPLPGNGDYTTDHDRVSYIIEHNNLGLPYYCMTASLYHPESGSLHPFDLAIDIEKECMILKPADPSQEYYIVAASNSLIQHSSILNYFERFLELCDHGEIPE